MKKAKVLFFTTLTIAAAILIGCRSSAKKMEDAEQNANAAEARLKQVRSDSAAAYEKTITEWNERVSANEKTIADYKVRITKEKKAARKKYEADLDELQKRNDELKIKMNEFKQDGKNNWEEFKTDFNKATEEFEKDLDKVGEYFKDLGKKI